MPFVKRRPGAPRGMLAWEAAGLAWLGHANGAEIVKVMAASQTSLTLTEVVPAAPTRTAATAFGAALSSTHAAGAAAFGVGPPGWSGDGFIADLPLPLGASPAWGRFYAEQRVWPYARTAAATGAVADLGPIERVCQRLVDGDFDDDLPPSRLHGDLWSGNVLFSPEGVVLIDPAAHGGHRLTDLAMLSLFGAPCLADILNSYAEVAPLPDGWRDLIGLHQLHPLLVHAVLFSGGYGKRAADVAARYC